MPSIPRGSTGLVIVTVAPGIMAPCSSTALIERLPVCTCANAGIAVTRSDAAARTYGTTLRMIPPCELDAVGIHRRAGTRKRFDATIGGDHAAAAELQALRLLMAVGALDRRLLAPLCNRVLVTIDARALLGHRIVERRLQLRRHRRRGRLRGTVAVFLMGRFLALLCLRGGVARVALGARGRRVRFVMEGDGAARRAGENRGAWLLRRLRLRGPAGENSAGRQGNQENENGT